LITVILFASDLRVLSILQVDYCIDMQSLLSMACVQIQRLGDFAPKPRDMQAINDGMRPQESTHSGCCLDAKRRHVPMVSCAPIIMVSACKSIDKYYFFNSFD
jgi:hypothetical protein